MKNGGIILIAIALLFIGMYIYAYSFEYFQKLKEERKLRKRIEKEALINEYKALNEKAREENSQRLTQRSQEIKAELERLSEFKNQLANSRNEKKKQLGMNGA